LNEWVENGTHFNCIGADAPGKEELDPAILRRSKIVIDDWMQASHSGEINVPSLAASFSERMFGLNWGSCNRHKGGSIIRERDYSIRFHRLSHSRRGNCGTCVSKGA